MLFFLLSCRNDAYRTSQYGDHIVVDLANKTEGDTEQSKPPAESFVLSDNLVRISLPNGTVSCLLRIAAHYAKEKHIFYHKGKITLFRFNFFNLKKC